MQETSEDKFVYSQRLQMLQKLRGEKAFKRREVTDFVPFTQERDSLGRLLKSEPWRANLDDD